MLSRSGPGLARRRGPAAGQEGPEEGPGPGVAVSCSHVDPVHPEHGLTHLNTNPSSLTSLSLSGVLR